MAGKFPVGRESIDRKINTVVGHIRVTLVHKDLDDPDDVIDGFRGSRMNRGPQNVERVGVVEVLPDHGLGKFFACDPFLVRTDDHLVVNVCEILDVGDLIPKPQKITPERVIHNERSRVSDMEKIIDRRSADINLKMAAFKRG